MKLKNFLIVVSDIEKSKEFYKNLFGLYVIADFGENVMLSEGLVLQEKKLWQKFTNKEVLTGGNDAELYFEENNMDYFMDKLTNSHIKIRYVNELMEHEWGQRVIRIYDPDNHIIEIGESLECITRRYLKSGMSIEEVSKKVQLPADKVKKIYKMQVV